ncbi:LysR family transcriptional regulator [Streptomyces sp. MUM 136J]|uniref:LysR family transcriptional regulator n=1 Tax=Streptomyces sp. MUM 136J TaxID=2791992 RepID=UPI001F04899A|nr:LysR family transcriptional regulator [Streptomyces sp. MUM 136J]MCH0569147.1 LysR family transcriptional regulator [Streptomyces sp. MUM 136J]
MLNPIHLHTLQAVLRTGSFADAARQLGYTGSAVSQQMSALERQVRTPLFERGAHGVRPTPAAEFIAGRSLEALGSLRALEDDVALLLDGVVGRLRLGSFPTASERLLPRALSAFTTDHPQVEVQLDEGEPAELLPMMESHELDIVLIYQYGSVPRRWPRGLCAEKLLTEDLLLLTPTGHPLTGGSEWPSIELLAEETWISTRSGTSAASMLRRLCAAAGFDPLVAYHSNNYAVLQGLVAAGLGVAVVPALGYTPGPGVSCTPLAHPDAYRQVVALRSPATTEGVWRTMLTALHASARETAVDAIGITATSATS